MVWSEQIGNAITVPADKAEGDGRDSITFGEEVPAELANIFSAGIFFKPGQYNPSATYQQVKYYGIAGRNVSFTKFLYIENYKHTPGNHRLIYLDRNDFDEEDGLLTFSGAFDTLLNPTDVPNQQIVSGVIQKYASGPFPITFAPGWEPFGPPTWNTPKWWVNALGEFCVTGHAKRNVALASGVSSLIFETEPDLKPYAAMMVDMRKFGSVPIRVDVYTSPNRVSENGGVFWIGNTEAMAVGDYIRMDFRYDIKGSW